MTAVLVQAHLIPINVFGSELVDGRSLGRVFWIAGSLIINRGEFNGNSGVLFD